jgi:hypothetical protein
MHWKLLRHFMTGACRGRPLVAPHALQGADRERRGRRVPVVGERYAEPGPQPLDQACRDQGERGVDPGTRRLKAPQR